MSGESVPGALGQVLKASQRLSRQEERDLICRAQNGDEGARCRLVECNLRLVLYVARRYRSASLTLEDLVQEGSIGLIDAIERFDPRCRNSFSAYAVPWIRLRIGRAVYRMTRMIRLPERSERLLARWNQLCGSRPEGSPTLEEGARELGVSVENLATALEAAQPIAPLHSVDADGESHSVEELVPRELPADPWESLARAENWAQVRRALRDLSPRHRQVLEASFGLGGREPRTLNDLAEEWGVTKQAVSGLRKRALESLRARLTAASFA